MTAVLSRYIVPQSKAMRKKRGRDTKGHRSKSKATLSSGRPSGFVDLPESYKDALAGVTGTFRQVFSQFHRAWKLSGRFSNQQLRLGQETFGER
jgi:hypothetical protein